MARLPKQSRILSEDFPKQDFMPKLLEPLNQFFQDVISSLNKNLTFKENIAGDVLTVSIDCSSLNTGVYYPIYPIDLKWTNTSRAMAAWIGQCREINGNQVLQGQSLYLNWSMSETGSFRINEIPGLHTTSATKFQLTIIAITG